MADEKAYTGPGSFWSGPKPAVVTSHPKEGEIQVRWQGGRSRTWIDVARVRRKEEL